MADPAIEKFKNRMKEGKCEIGKQVFQFFSFSRTRFALGKRAPATVQSRTRMPSAARIRADEIPGRSYYREALVLKYTPGAWHLQF